MNINDLHAQELPHFHKKRLLYPALYSTLLSTPGIPQLEIIVTCTHGKEQTGLSFSSLKWVQNITS